MSVSILSRIDNPVFGTIDKVHDNTIYIDSSVSRMSDNSRGPVLGPCKLSSVDSSNNGNPVSGYSDSMGPVLRYCKPSSIDSGHNIKPVKTNSYGMGPLLGPCKPHSIVSKDTVNLVAVDLDNSDSVGPVLGSSKLCYIDSSDNTTSVPSNSYDMGPVLVPFKLHSIVSKDNVNPVSVDLGNIDCVGLVLGPCKLLPISPEAVNPNLAFRMLLVEEELTGEVQVCWDREPVVYIPAQSDVD